MNAKHPTVLQMGHLGMDIGEARVGLALIGQAGSEAAQQLEDLAQRHQTAMLAAVEQIDPEEFVRRVNLRRRRDALRRNARKAAAARKVQPKRQVKTASKPTSTPLVAAAPEPVSVTVRVVRR